MGNSRSNQTTSGTSDRGGYVRPLGEDLVDSKAESTRREEEGFFSTEDELDTKNKLKNNIEVIREVKKEFTEGNKMLKMHMFDKAKNKYTNALDTLRKLSAKDDHKDTSDVSLGAVGKLVQVLKDDNRSEAQERLALSNLGVIQFAEGRYENAKRLLEKAIQVRDCYLRCEECDEKDVKPDSHAAKETGLGSEIKTTDAEDLGSLVSLSIELSKDITFHRIPDNQKILQSRISEHGSIDAITADLMNNMAACYEVIGDIDSARAMYEESLKLRQLIFGKRSLKAADLMQNLATVLDSQGRVSEAKALLEEALSIQVEQHGENSIETAVTINNLGVLSAHLGDLLKAESYLRRTLEARERVYGADHAFTRTAQQNLSYILNKRKCIEAPPNKTFSVVEV